MTVTEDEEVVAEEEEDEEEEESEDLSSMTKAELFELAEERGVEVPKSANKAKLVELLGGGTEHYPVIRVGDWVQLATNGDVPRHLGNLDAVVLRAPVKRSDGGDVFSTTPYEYQDGSEEFLVRVRHTGDELTLTREAFAAHGTQRAHLGFRS